MSEETKFVPTLKFLLLGSSCKLLMTVTDYFHSIWKGVGKTSILNQYVENVFSNDMIATVGVDFASKKIILDGTIIKLQIWDTAGAELYRSISRSYYRGSSAILLVFDLTDYQSFVDVKAWIHEIDKEVDLQKIVLVLLGNKLDLMETRKVQAASAQKIADLYEIKYFETSAKTRQNLEEAFIFAASTAIQKKPEVLINSSKPKQNNLSPPLSPKNRCC